jgi:deazaflavin-dependent oxidoreductase (nitroreductase family)
MGIPQVDPTVPRTFAQRSMVAFSMTSAGTWFLKNISRRMDPALHRASGGRLTTVMVTPVVLLTATGAKSGVERTIPLLYFTDRDRVIVMASNYGGQRHPAWYHNVTVNSHVTLSAGGFAGRFVAAEATGEERERLWGLAQQLAATYGRYEVRSGRQIPLITFTAVE